MAKTTCYGRGLDWAFIEAGAELKEGRGGTGAGPESGAGIGEVVGGDLAPWAGSEPAGAEPSGGGGARSRRAWGRGGARR